MINNLLYINKIDVEKKRAIFFYKFSKTADPARVTVLLYFRHALRATDRETQKQLRTTFYFLFIL